MYNNNTYPEPQNLWTQTRHPRSIGEMVTRHWTSSLPNVFDPRQCFTDPIVRRDQRDACLLLDPEHRSERNDLKSLLSRLICVAAAALRFFRTPIVFS